MPEITVLTTDVHLVEGTVSESSATLPLADLERVTGFVLKDVGLCSGPTCIPLMGRTVVTDEVVDLVALAAVLGRTLVLDADAEMVAMSDDAQLRSQVLNDKVAPEVVLPDLDGTLHALSASRGKKTLLVTFATWCGCRYDLPGWQALLDELGDDNLAIYAVAIDEFPEKVRKFTGGFDGPVMIDRHHVLSEVYAMSNVPTVVWIDEEGTIALPNSLAFGTDTFAEFTGVSSGPHLDAVRAWVRTGAVPEAANEAVADLSLDEVEARLHFRIGAELARRGAADSARAHFDVASALAPSDWTVRRAAMPLSGRDPFGQEFLDLYDQWQKDGAPYHGVTAL